ncbi:MAG: ABC transporter ATP-binding protein [Anaerolineae bacterium]|nr:ABC transporter ATP-binding protein [Anaerolineae bacterium]
MRTSRRGRGAQDSADANDKTPQTPVKWGRLFSYLSPYKGRMAIAIVALAIYTGINLVFPLVISQLIALVLEQKSMDQLNTLTLQLVVLFLIQAGFSFIQSFQLTYIGEKIIFDIRTQLFKHMSTLSFDFFAGRPVGELISRMSNDVSQVRELLTTSVTQFLTQIVTLAGSLILMFLFNPSLMVFILILVPVLFGAAFAFSRPLSKLSTKVQDALANATNIATEALGGIRIVKSFTREPYEVQRYDSGMQNSFDLSIRLTVYRSAFGALMSFLGFGTLAAFLWFSGREVVEGRLTAQSIVLFLIYGINVAASLGFLANIYRQFREVMGATRRVFEILDTKPSVDDAPNAKALPTVQGQITFDNVSFGYEERMTVLDGINLDIQPGEIVALVGPSGAGKSTMFNLIPRFYDPTLGTMRIDGQDLRTVKQDSLRAQIGIVPQETVLFGGTIRENILYGRLEASEQEMIEAAKAANAHDFIMELPDKYETVVGERGIKLSGGQRQRVAIARAILKNPRILLLDEATSSLDNESEELVQEALDHLMQHRTTVIIAHRLSTIKIAHRICVLDHGKIVELGTHEDLMALNGLYAKLYLMQFREGEELLTTKVG